MFSNTTLSFIGGGAMAEAMIAGILRQQLLPAHSILVSEPRAEQRDKLQKRYQVGVTPSNASAARFGEIVIVAVKPQFLGVALPELKGELLPQALLISIVAGGLIRTFANALGHERIVRTIPNTPATIGQGVTAWMATAAVSPEQRAQTGALLAALGAQVEVTNEKMIDMATGVSGSGPAYVFLLMEAMIDGAVRVGLARPVAEQLVLQTFRGAVEYAQQSDSNLAALRHQVTSPGGTTAAGLQAMESGAVRALLANAVMAAFQRSQELSEN